jgi:6-phosphogluconate dehydrogenase
MMAGRQIVIPMDDVFLSARVNGMYRNMINGNYKRVIRAMNATLNNLNIPEMVYLDRSMSRMAHDKISRALVKMAVRDYQGAHTYLRDLHYAIDV